MRVCVLTKQIREWEAEQKSLLSKQENQRAEASYSFVRQLDALIWAAAAGERGTHCVTNPVRELVSAAECEIHLRQRQFPLEPLRAAVAEICQVLRARLTALPRVLALTEFAGAVSKWPTSEQLLERARAQQKAHDEQLARVSGSILEHAWLSYVGEHGHRKPDRGQHTISGADVCADFFYADLNLAIFVDGPHHDRATQRADDAAIDRRLDDLGYLVVRFPKEQSAWPAIFTAHADLLGAGR